MQKKALTLEALAAQVVARQKFIEEVLGFVTGIVAKRGKVLFREVHECHIEVKAELKNFAGFSFYTYGSYTMYGGQTAKVWFHPGSVKTGAEPVLEVEWWDIEKCTVKRFDPSRAWQRAIRPLMRNEERVAKISAAKQKKQEEREQRAAARDAELRRAAADLKKNAERLGLSNP